MRPPRPARRDWLLVAVALLLIGTYWVVWVGYVKIHTVTRSVAAAPGAPVVADGQTLRVLSLVRTDTLSSRSPGIDPQVATAGAEFIVATLSYGTDRTRDYGDCRPDLIGPQRQVWEPITPEVSRRNGASCSDLTAGQQLTVEVVFEVPTELAGQVLGVALDDPTSIDRVPILRPPG